MTQRNPMASNSGRRPRQRSWRCGRMTDHRPPTNIDQRTKPGVYIPTAITVGWALARVRPFALARPSQFRPKPPPSLTSALWARDYNEVKELGDRDSVKRTPRQTEDARFLDFGQPRHVAPTRTADCDRQEYGHC